MKADFVADIGNTRIKWGRCVQDRVTEIVSLPPNDPEIWQRQLQSWQISDSACWYVAGVNPQRRDFLIDWLRQQAQQAVLLQSAAELPLQVALEKPNAAGIDRLLDAVAANTRREACRPAVIVDAGSAVTVDWLDEAGVFRGGAIFPGLRLMSQALNSYTALLPLVSITSPAPKLPGDSTRAAIEAGVYWSVAGGITALIARMAEKERTLPMVFLTGGDAQLLSPAVDPSTIVWPEMTLEGIRIAACGLALASER